MFAPLKFGSNKASKLPKLFGLLLFNNCVYHEAGYIIACPSTNGRALSWTCRNYFSCDTKNLTYFLICKLAITFILNKLKVLNKETQSANLYQKPVQVAEARFIPPKCRNLKAAGVGIEPTHECESWFTSL